MGTGGQAVVGMGINIGEVHRLLALEPLFKMRSPFLCLAFILTNSEFSSPYSYLPLKLSTRGSQADALLKCQKSVA